MRMVITHGTLAKAMDLARAGKVTLYIPTFTRCTIIDAKSIARFDAAGVPVLRPAKDGQGFLLRSGKRSVYLFAGQLVAEGA